MIYEFCCTFCGNTEEFIRSMAKGPPKEVNCELCKEINGTVSPMRHIIGGNFILKGAGWPGKELKSRDRAMDKSKEENNNQLAEDKKNQRIVDEVMDIRRKGTKATKDLRENDPQRFADYKAAIKKGYRAKAKSYNAKIGND